MSWKQRLKRRFGELWPVILGSLFFLLLLSLIGWATEPWWPEPLHLLYNQLYAQQWQEGLQHLRVMFHSYGKWQPWVFVGIQALQVLLAPIPGQLMGLLGGLLFGFGKGLLLTLLGLTIGSAMAIGLGRLVGWWLVHRFVSATVMLHFEYLIERGGLLTFFLLFLLPALPDDAICLLAGLTRHRFTALLGVCVVGRLPGMAILTWVGSSLNSNATWIQMALSLLSLAAMLIWLFQEEVRDLFHRFLATTAPEKA